MSFISRVIIYIEYLKSLPYHNMISPQRQFNFISFFVLLSNIGQVVNSYQDELPFCGLTEKFDRFILVSTLDGKLTALNPDEGGSELWNVHPGNEPMLSSSIHRLELTNYGQMVRMIPSLNGGLYKFNGETVEPIPLTADNLLQASLRYSDDLVISGGKESQTVGISLKSGKVLYECSMKGCKDDREKSVGDVLLVQRMGQVVRAVESRTGVERWNFSVAQHELKLISGCHTTDLNSPQLNLKVIVPSGVVCAMDPVDSTLTLWKHKFDSPVVNVWEIQKDNIFKIDLFSRITDTSPSLYIGMHDKQLYIQESVNMLEKRHELAMNFGKNYLTHEKDDNSLPWLPVIANAKHAGLGVDENDSTSLDSSMEEGSTTALSVLYASPYIEGMGFYLYTKQAIQDAKEGSCNVTIQTEPEKDEESEDTPVTIVIVSLWYWWREVTVISITTAIVFNLIFTRRFLRLRNNQSLLPTAEKRLTGSDSGISMETKMTEATPIDYKSRYLTDFDPVNCLGKGGFGVVFEAKNKIDDCNYAIKRIILPDAPTSRERVMREVRALAKLDHNNIVRYFNSWMECPPADWQRDQDRKLISNDDFETNCLTSEAVTNCYPAPSTSPSHETTGNLSLKNHRDDEDDSDSFIVFGNDSSQSRAEPEHKDHSILIEDSTSSRNQTPCKKVASKKAIWSDHNAICQSPSKVYLYIQMQLCRKESLKDWLLQNPNRDYFNILEIFEQIVSAVYYVHENNLIHRDLKPSNIFFSMDQQIKVGDFGLVTTIVEDTERKNVLDETGVRKRHTSQVGTQLYMSPEQLSGQPYSYKVDIFSLGLILFELLVPFSTQMERLKTLEDIRQHKFPIYFTSKYQTEHDLLQKMLAHSPTERPNTCDLLTGPPLMREAATGDTPIGVYSFKRHRRQSSKTSGSSISGSEICLGVRDLTS